MTTRSLPDKAQHRESANKHRKHTDIHQSAPPDIEYALSAWQINNPIRTEFSMSKTKEQYADRALVYRAKAAASAQDVAGRVGDARKRQIAYTALAENQEWLAENFQRVL